MIDCLVIEKMESDLGKLFIGGISWDTDEERLRDYFGSYGEVVEAVIMRDRSTGRARGFGFVVFADPAVAERVILEKHIIDGRTVEAKKAVPKDDQNTLNRNNGSIHGSPISGRTKKIFVGGLASTVTEADFQKYFDQFGTITDVVVMYDHSTQRPRGFGFITYDSEEAVDRVLHKTFHELNGKMVEVKRAIPKELTPGSNRSPIVGYNYGMSRASGFLNSYTQSYNMSPLGSYGVRADGRLSPAISSRTGIPHFGTNNYGVGVNLEQGLRQGYGRSLNIMNSQAQEQMLNSYYNGNSNRFITPIGYSGGNGRGDSLLSSSTWNVWGNGSMNNAMNSPDPGAFSGSGMGNFRVAYGNDDNWSSAAVGNHVGVNAPPGYTNNNGYGIGESEFGIRGGSYGRNGVVSSVATRKAFAETTDGYERSYRELYRDGMVHEDSTWPSTTPELDGSVPFGYGLGSLPSDDPAKSSENFLASYDVSSRQSSRGIAA
ncbi:heterogeneous nuclear ribonucleoprotein 1-like isoform X1 [Cucurbita moschata]|uniref:Heterogeneous nuclear ribonucleoprotein 1-like isoform X1 n=2 Tax=Cucurbita moschata TaxID=3662 RepID=A0A6J1HBD5_CUCMO|nr:heterogeneous nuclear ribonucleoprotein 1-like isoform X1 [Cucurbita moschata]